MTKWLFKSCPRCEGDLYFDERTNPYEVWYTCLNCGNQVKATKVEKEKIWQN